MNGGLRVFVLLPNGRWFAHAITCDPPPYDLAPSLVAEHGELAVHGIAMRPSSQTGFGRIGRRLVFLLPGNPVSSLCAYDFFAGRAIRALAGRDKAWPYRQVRATLQRKISSPVGRLDYARVKPVDGVVEPIAATAQAKR